MANYERQIRGIYSELLGRAPDPEGLAYFTKAATAGGSLDTIRGSIYGSAEAKKYRTSQAQQQRSEYQDTIAGLETKMSNMASSFQAAAAQQQAQFQEAQRKQQERMELMQQQAIAAQARQAVPQQSPQVLGVGNSLAIRRLAGGASKLFNRPTLQIKSVNI